MADRAPQGADGPQTVPTAVDAMIRQLRRRLDEQRDAVLLPGTPAPPQPEAVERARRARLEQRAEAEAITIRQGAEVAAARIVADALARADALVSETEEGVAHVWAETRAAIDERLAEVAMRIAEAEALTVQAVKDADELRAGAARYLTDVRRRADDELRKEVEASRSAVYAEIAGVLARASERSRLQAEPSAPPEPGPPEASFTSAPAGPTAGPPRRPAIVASPPRPADTTLLPARPTRDDPPAPGPLDAVSVRSLDTEPAAADDLLMAGEVRIGRGPPLPGSRPLAVAVAGGAAPDQHSRGFGHWLRRRRPQHGSHPPG